MSSGIKKKSLLLALAYQLKQKATKNPYCVLVSIKFDSKFFNFFRATDNNNLLLFFHSAQELAFSLFCQDILERKQKFFSQVSKKKKCNSSREKLLRSFCLLLALSKFFSSKQQQKVSPEKKQRKNYMTSTFLFIDETCLEWPNVQLLFFSAETTKVCFSKKEINSTFWEKLLKSFCCFCSQSFFLPSVFTKKTTKG